MNDDKVYNQIYYKWFLSRQHRLVLDPITHIVMISIFEDVKENE